MGDSAYPTIFYPPRPGIDEGIVMSMRSVNIGDAIEDFDYLKLYEKRVGKKAVKKLLSSLLPEATATPKDPLQFLELRRQIAETLEETP